MELEALRVFLAVAAHQSITRAASALGLRQSAISRKIQGLEQSLDTRVFYRNGRGVRLTAAGEKLQRVATEVIEALDALTAELRAEHSGFQGEVTLGLPPSLGATISAGLVRRFQEGYPQARLRIMVAFSATLLEWLDDGRIDVGVLYDVHRSRTLLVTPLLNEALHLVSRPAAAGTAAIAELPELGVGPYALPSTANGMRRIVDAAATRNRIRMQVSAEIDSLDAMKELVEAGPERCVLPLGAVHREVRAGRLAARRFAGTQLQALLVLATPVNRPVNPLASAVQRLIQAEVARCLADGSLSGTIP